MDSLLINWANCNRGNRNDQCLGLHKAHSRNQTNPSGPNCFPSLSTFPLSLSKSLFSALVSLLPWTVISSEFQVWLINWRLLRESLIYGINWKNWKQI
ncbi:hypothetical protein IMY05_005G0092900 [Salix suchowensis]|nr:hypothetical protein IMY05_005G0092900 [Salix suchowensis]